MKNIYKLLFLFVIIIGCSNSNKQKWIVTNYKIGKSLCAFDEHDADRYIGKNIQITNEQVIIFGDTCTKPIINTEKLNSFDYLNLECAEKDFSIIQKDSIIITRIKYASKPKYGNPDSLNFNYDLIEISDREIMVPINGIYFFLKKNNDTVQ